MGILGVRRRPSISVCVLLVFVDAFADVVALKRWASSGPKSRELLHHWRVHGQGFLVANRKLLGELTLPDLDVDDQLEKLQDYLVRDEGGRARWPRREYWRSFEALNKSRDAGARAS